MRVEFRGGADDGLVFDTDDQGASDACSWCCPAFEVLPLPPEVEMRSWRGGRAVYVLTAASELGGAVYTLDPIATSRLTGAPSHTVLQ